MDAGENEFYSLVREPDALQSEMSRMQERHLRQTMEQQHRHLQQLKQLQERLVSQLASQTSSRSEPGFGEDELTGLLEAMNETKTPPGMDPGYETRRTAPNKDPANEPPSARHRLFSVTTPPESVRLPVQATAARAADDTDKAMAARERHTPSVPPLVDPNTALQLNPSDQFPKSQLESLERLHTVPSLKDSEGFCTPSTSSIEFLQLPDPSNSTPYAAFDQLHPLRSPQQPPHHQAPSCMRPDCHGDLANNLSVRSSCITRETSVAVENPNRAVLVEKHRKHVEDLQSYYESQISVLKGQLGSLQPQMAVLGTHSPSTVAATLTPSPVKSRSGQSPTSLLSSEREKSTNLRIQRLLAENGQLLARCVELENHLDEQYNGRQTQEEDIRRLQKELWDSREQQESTERLVSLMQSRLHSAHQQLRERERVNSNLNKELHSLGEELHLLKRENAELRDSVKQEMENMQILRDENAILQTKNAEMIEQVAEMKSELDHCQAVISNHENSRERYESVILELEGEVRTLKHMNIRLHNQVTHFDMGNPYNSSDEKKLRYSSTSLTPEQHLLPSSHQWTSSERGRELVSSLAGPGGSSSSNKKLTRKKWLETSEGGLLFGSPQLYQGQDTDDEQDEIQRPSHSTSIKRLVPRSPQAQADTIARQPQANAVVARQSQADAVARQPMDLREKVELRMRAIADAEKRIDELQKEKHQLESALQRAPPAGLYTAHEKQRRRELDARLDEVIREIGSVKMVLRTSNPRHK